MNAKEIEKLLFNEDLADLLFLWNDGTRIPAHSQIVFPVAPYFRLDFLLKLAPTNTVFSNKI